MLSVNKKIFLFTRTFLRTARYLLDKFVIFLVVVPILMRRKGVVFQYSGLALEH